MYVNFSLFSVLANNIVPSFQISSFVFSTFMWCKSCQAPLTTIMRVAKKQMVNFLFNEWSSTIEGFTQLFTELYFLPVNQCTF